MKNLQCIRVFKNIFCGNRFIFEKPPEGAPKEQVVATKPTEPLFKKPEEVFKDIKEVADKAGTDSASRDKLTKLDPKGTGENAKLANIAEANKFKKGDKLPPEIEANLKAANDAIEALEKQYELMKQVAIYKAQVELIDKDYTMKDKYADGMTYDPSKSAEFKKDLDAMPVLKKKYEGLNAPAGMEKADQDATGVPEKIAALGRKIDAIKTAADPYYAGKRDTIDGKVGIKLDKVKQMVKEGGKNVEKEVPQLKLNRIDEIKLAEGYKDKGENEKVRLANSYFSDLNSLRTELVGAKDEYAQLTAQIDADPILTPDQKNKQKAEIDKSKKLIDDQLKAVDAKIATMDKDGIKVSADYLTDKKDTEKKILDDTMRASGDLQTKLNAELLKLNPELRIPATNADDQKALTFTMNQLVANNPKLYDDATAALKKWQEQTTYVNSLNGLKGTTAGLPEGSFDPKTGAITDRTKLYAAWDKTSTEMGVNDGSNKDIVRPTEPKKEGFKGKDADYAKAMQAYRKDYSAYMDKWYGKAGKMTDKDNPWPPKSGDEIKQEGEKKITDDVETRTKAKEWASKLDIGKSERYAFSDQYDTPHIAENALRGMLESIYVAKGETAAQEAYSKIKLKIDAGGSAQSVNDIAQEFGVDKALATNDKVTWFQDGRTRGYVMNLMGSAGDLGDKQEDYKKYITKTLGDMQPQMLEMYNKNPNQETLDAIHSLVVSKLLTPKDWQAGLNKPAAKKEVAAVAPVTQKDVLAAKTDLKIDVGQKGTVDVGGFPVIFRRVDDNNYRVLVADNPQLKFTDGDIYDAFNVEPSQRLALAVEAAKKEKPEVKA